mmetsp:Transcript_54795/g.134004  ORF Transcript_54795/g.134004 Transcript_54795/m.134004 type:complete len:228 (+) Transcript_54795:1489-2172(+)
MARGTFKSSEMMAMASPSISTSILNPSSPSTAPSKRYSSTPLSVVLPSRGLITAKVGPRATSSLSRLGVTRVLRPLLRAVLVPYASNSVRTPLFVSASVESTTTFSPARDASSMLTSNFPSAVLRTPPSAFVPPPTTLTLASLRQFVSPASTCIARLSSEASWSLSLKADPTHSASGPAGSDSASQAHNSKEVILWSSKPSPLTSLILLMSCAHSNPKRMEASRNRP